MDNFEVFPSAASLPLLTKARTALKPLGVASLPGATCRLHRLPVTGDNVSRTSNSFTTDSSGWAYILWGALWPTTPTAVTARFYGYCTAHSPDTRTAQSDYVSVQWPPRASPTPSPSPS